MSRLLLDTHVVLWWLEAPERLTDEAQEAIANPESDPWVSSASVWEITIKAAKGRVKLPQPFEPHLTDAGLQQLPILWSHASAVRELEQHHQDPFDRMLVAQAQVEAMTVVSRDPWIQRYNVPMILA